MCLLIIHLTNSYAFRASKSFKMFYVNRQKNKAAQKIVTRPSVNKLSNYGISVNDKL